MSEEVRGHLTCAFSGAPSPLRWLSLSAAVITGPTFCVSPSRRPALQFSIRTDVLLYRLPLKPESIDNSDDEQRVLCVCLSCGEEALQWLLLHFNLAVSISLSSNSVCQSIHFSGVCSLCSPQKAPTIFKCLTEYSRKLFCFLF